MDSDPTTHDGTVSCDRTLIMVCIGAGMLGLLSFAFWDHRVALWCYQHDRLWYSHLLPLGFRQLGKGWAPVWLLFLWFLATRRAMPVLTTVFAFVLLLPVVPPLKALVGRVRPGIAIAAAHAERPGEAPRHGHSFPSGDAATAFAVTGTLVGYLRKPWHAVLYGLAAAIAVLRVLVCVHYPSDVCAGAVIGLVCALVARRHNQWLMPAAAGLKQKPVIAVAVLLVLPVAVAFIDKREPVKVFFQTIGIAALFIYAIYYGVHRMRISRQQNDSSDRS